MNLLLVDDDPHALSYLSGLLRDAHRVTTCVDGAEALTRLRPRTFDLVLTDLRMPGPDGFEILRAAQALEPPIPVVVLTAVDSARPAVDALRLGARDFLVKPASPEEIAATIARVERECAPSASDPAEEDSGLVGGSPAIRLVRRLVPSLAASRETVLIVGETGTGKELLARALHARSPRSAGPFVAHNMAATPIELAESIFLGHARGAFSGAASEHPGLFEQADHGTLFLDEIDSFPLPLQPKLLRVLEGGSIQRIGACAERKFDVRVIAASAVDLGPCVAAGAFRADLYYRLRQLEVELPPLRERQGDIAILVRRFLDDIGRETGVAPRVDPAAMSRLLGHSWPGNVRELRNVVRAAAVMAGLDPIRCEHLSRALRTDARPDPQNAGSLRSREMRHILEILDRVAGNQSLAARILGIDRGTLARKLSAARTNDAAKPTSHPGHGP